MIDTRAVPLTDAATKFCDVICEIDVGTVVVENVPQYTVPSSDNTAWTTAVVLLATTVRELMVGGIKAGFNLKVPDSTRNILTVVCVCIQP